MSICTCSYAPPCVDLTAIIEESKNNGAALEEQKEILRKALTRWGWCHVSVDTSRISSKSPLGSLNGPGLKNEIESLFNSEFLGLFRPSNNGDIFSVKNHSATYRGRTAESGAASSARAEPKQSWEVLRCHRSSKPDPRLDSLTRWTQALHSVALMVTCLLELPPNVLMRQDACEDVRHESDFCSSDLLRVFYYDAVKEANTLGSSPHTDWGGWTVVWQDDVGGLQTQCPLHNRWVDVPAPAPHELDNRIRFVVHVGDVTSLAMGRAASRCKRKEENGVASKADDSIVVWPSPRHQVVCPIKTISRASLVYFAYPPPCVSLQDMEEALEPWWKLRTARHGENTPTVRVPYEHYSLLQNQSVEGASSSPQHTYECIRSRPLDGVFADKWQQVQRG